MQVNSMKFSIPFNDEYVNFKSYRENILEKYLQYIDNIYYSLPVEISPNARTYRIPFTLNDTCNVTEIFASKKIKPYIVLNSSWTPLSAYTEEYLTTLTMTLKSLYDAGLYGVTVQNNYLMNIGIFDHIPDLKIIASINQMIDTYEKAVNLLNIIPKYSGIHWCRNINPNIDYISKINNLLKEDYPNLTTTILLNEGCLLYCPFKKDHDNLIGMLSYTNEDLNEYNKKIFTKYSNLNDILNNLNITTGCIKMFSENENLKQLSPYITPENFKKYIEMNCADIYKIAGRTNSVEWIDNAINSYITGLSDNKDYLDSGIGG